MELTKAAKWRHANSYPRLEAAVTRLKGPEKQMTSNTTVLITDMAILVGIFLLGLLAKLFPRNGRRAKQ
jgi:hypothetical protein